MTGKPTHPAGLRGACRVQRPDAAVDDNQPKIRIVSARTGAASPARRLQPRDRAQARDLRCGIFVQARLPTRASSARGRTSTIGPRIASTTMGPRAIGRSSPDRMAAPRCAIARTSRRRACPPARSSSGRRGASRQKDQLATGSTRVALAGFLVLARRRLFLDGHAMALLDLFAPAAVGVGHAIALGHPLPSLIL